MPDQMHETQFLEVPTDEAIWMQYAAAFASHGNMPKDCAAFANQLMKLHRQVWPKDNDW